MADNGFKLVPGRITVWGRVTSLVSILSHSWNHNCHSASSLQDTLGTLNSLTEVVSPFGSSLGNLIHIIDVTYCRYCRFIWFLFCFIGYNSFMWYASVRTVQRSTIVRPEGSQKKSFPLCAFFYFCSSDPQKKRYFVFIWNHHLPWKVPLQNLQLLP